MDRSGLLEWLSSSELQSLDTSQKNILEALEFKAEDIEKDNIDSLLSIDGETVGLLEKLETADTHLAAVQIELEKQLQNIRTLRNATASLEEKSSQINLAQSNRIKLMQCIEQYLK